MHLSTGFGDETAGTENYLTVVGPEAYFSLDDDGVFVLVGMQVRRCYRADSEGVLEDGYLAAGVAAVQFEDCPKTRNSNLFSFSRKHDLDFVRAAHIHQDFLPWTPYGRSFRCPFVISEHGDGVSGRDTDFTGLY
jgi:hypothetical protein